MTFASAYAFTLAHEVGWWPGGERDPNPTLDGVTQRAYDTYRRSQNLPTRTVRDMDAAERSAIYRRYWDDCGADLLPARAANAHFAFAFNAGPVQAVKVLQRALGVEADGRVGPRTRAAILAAADATLLPALLLEQLAYYHTIARPAHLRPNLMAWVGRVVGAWRFRPPHPGD